VRAVVSAVGGPMLFLIGAILFKLSVRGWLQLSHGVGIIALGVLGWYGEQLSPLTLSLATTVLMVIVAVWESMSLRSRPRSQSEATSA
jgi:low temperature requirement protein LtrA